MEFLWTPAFSLHSPTFQPFLICEMTLQSHGLHLQVLGAELDGLLKSSLAALWYLLSDTTSRCCPLTGHTVVKKGNSVLETLLLLEEESKQTAILIWGWDLFHTPLEVKWNTTLKQCGIHYLLSFAYFSSKTEKSQLCPDDVGIWHLIFNVYVSLGNDY